MSDSGNRILVINPNSNRSVTRGIERAVRDLRLPAEVVVDCIDHPNAPPGIETDEDVTLASAQVLDTVLRQSANYDAFVVACYSDPGVEACRNETDKVVVGIQESALTLSASFERQFGVLALSRESIQRHIHYVRGIGLQEFHAGERPLNLSVDAAANDPDALQRIIDVGNELVDEDGAETIVLGCAGMSSHRRAAQNQLSVPVIDPVQAGVSMAHRMLSSNSPGN